MQSALDILRERGFIAQITFEEDLDKAFREQKITFYTGFDPTADSLHIGHYIPIMAMAHMQRAGHQPIALIGGGTGMIGDPSGKSDMRKMMTMETVNHNVECFKKQMARFLSFEGENGVIVADLGDQLICRVRDGELPLKGQEQENLVGELGYYSVYTVLTKEEFLQGADGEEIPFPGA